LKFLDRMMPLQGAHFISPSETTVPQMLVANTLNPARVQIPGKNYGNRFSSEKRPMASKK